MLDKFRETAITWDKANRKVYEPLRVSAGDNKGRKLSVQVANGGVIEDLSGASLSLFWETKDKAYKGLDAFDPVDATKGEFELSYTAGMLSNEGTLNANLVLVDASGRVVSELFTITVFKGIDDDAIQSSNSFTALAEALITVNQYNSRITNVENNKADKITTNALTGRVTNVENNKVDKSTFEQSTNDLTAQLQQIAFNVRAYGAKGDGVTDDTASINAVLSGGNKTVFIPASPEPYIISSPIIIESNTKLVLSEGVTIKLADNANCPIVVNKNQTKTIIDKNIEIIGGVFDHNANNQTRNDANTPGVGNPETEWFGICFKLLDIRGLKLSNFTVKNSVSWGVLLGNVHDFSVNEIRFDNAKDGRKNTDGVHLSHASNGVIDTIRGFTGDDMVALNADDYGIYRVREGAINNISISNIFGDGSYRAIRLLSHKSHVYDIKISNIFGEYLNEAVILTVPSGFPNESHFYRIDIESVFATATYGKSNVEIVANVDELALKNFYRKQENYAGAKNSPSIVIRQGYTVKSLFVDNVSLFDSSTGGIAQILVQGNVELLKVENIRHIGDGGANKGKVIELSDTAIIDILIVTGAEITKANQFVNNNGVIGTLNINDIGFVGGEIIRNKKDIARLLINNLRHDATTFIYSDRIAQSGQSMTSLLSNIIGTGVNAPLYLKNTNVFFKFTNVNGITIPRENIVSSAFRAQGSDLLVDTRALTGAVKGDYVRASNADNVPVFYDGAKWLNQINGAVVN